MRDNLEELAGYVKKLNALRNGSPLTNIKLIEKRICQIIGRNACTSGNINEYVCEEIFNITRKKGYGYGYDGFFKEGKRLQGSTVDFKYSRKHNCRLNIGNTYPDYYLAVRGPIEGADV